jgi:hypothetical protein
MGNKDNKQDVFNKIAALRTLNEGYPKFNLTNSVPSINNSDEVIAFLLDLIISLIGSEELKDVSVDFLSRKLPDIEFSVKNGIKKTLNDGMNMGTNPKTPSFLINGFDIQVKNIDLLDKFKIDPKSETGQLIYDDSTNGLNSINLDTFLFETVQTENQSNLWGSQVGVNTILDIKHIDNTLNVKSGNDYNTKTLRDFNNDYIDSLKLFNPDKVINRIMDKIFGVISNTLGKTRDSLIMEAKLNDIIENFINAKDNDVVDDSYFQFSNEQLTNQEFVSTNRSNGVAVLIDCDNYTSSINFNTLSGISQDISNSTTLNEMRVIISNSITKLLDEATLNTSDVDKNNVKTGFFKIILKELIISLIEMILSPQILLLLLINNKVFGLINFYKDIIELIRSNTLFIKNIVCVIKDVLINLLLAIIIKEILRLITAQTINKEKESAKNKLLSIMSLLSVPQEMMLTIRGL